MMPSWNERIAAAGAEDPTKFAAAAKLQAFSDAQQLYRTTLRTAGPGLRDAAERAAQVAVFAGRDAGAAIIVAFDGPFQRIRKMADLAESPIAVASVAAYGGVARALDQRVDGVAPLDPRASLDIAAFGVDAAALPRDVIDGIERLDVTPIARFIDAFPGGRYVELLGLAAALCTSAAQRGFLIDVGATWLARAIREDVVAPAPSPAMLARAANAVRAPAMFAPGPARDGTARAWRSIELDARHGLWPGVVVTVAADGEVSVVETSGYTPRGEPHRARLADAALAALDTLLATHDLRGIAIPLRGGVAGEASVKLTLIAERTIVVSKWASDHHPGFDAIQRWLRDVASVLGASRGV